MTNTGEMPWDNIFDFNEDFGAYRKSRMRMKIIHFELCVPDCPYYYEKHKLKPNNGVG